MWGQYVGTLKVKSLTNIWSNSKVLWIREGDHGNRWLPGQIEIGWPLAHRLGSPHRLGTMVNEI